MISKLDNQIGKGMVYNRCQDNDNQIGKGMIPTKYRVLLTLSKITQDKLDNQIGIISNHLSQNPPTLAGQEG